MLQAPARLPQEGASILVPRGISGVPIAPGATPKPFVFRWPFRTYVYAMTLCTDLGTPSSLAGLSLQIVDGTQLVITTDGQGFKPDARALALIGIAGGLGLGYGRPYALQRLVQTGEMWTFRFRNSGPATVTPELAFRLGEPHG